MAYLIRLYFRGVAHLAIASLLIYSIVVYVPGGPKDIYDELRPCPPRCSGNGPYTTRQLEVAFHVDKPWPLSYAAWLYTAKMPPDDPVSTEVKMPSMYSKDTSILTGDLGYSWRIFHNTPVASVLGIEPWGLPLVLLAATLGLSLLALLRMRRRRPTHELDDAYHVEPPDENFAARASLAQTLRTPR